MWVKMLFQQKIITNTKMFCWNVWDINKEMFKTLIPWIGFKVNIHRIGTYKINMISLSCFDDKK